LSKYRAARRSGLGNEAAVRAMLVDAGPALLGTAAVLLAGFAVLTFSGFQMTSYLGILVVLILGPGVFADLLVLPPLMMTLGEPLVRRSIVPFDAPEVSKP
jgi:predicted RND superfamily exporter protein